jgi:hypothetical protein
MNNPVRNKIGQFASPKNILIGKFTLISLLFLVAIGGGYKLIDRVAQYLHAHELVKYKAVKIEFHRPFEFVPNEEMAKRRETEALIENLTNKVIEEMLNPNPGQVDAILTSNAPISPSEFFDRIWNHETTRGKDKTPGALHMYCRSKGMWNEIGYNPQAKFCFKDRTEAELFVAYYLKKNCSGMSFNQALCFWNTGKDTPTCPYAEGNLSMAN